MSVKTESLPGTSVSYCAAVLTLAALTACPVSASASESGIYFKVDGLSQPSLQEVVGHLEGVRVVVIGEEHASRQQHQAQLAVIRALFESGRKVAVALEMFRADAQEELDLWSGGKMSTARFFDVYAENWHPDFWWIYFDIFRYARDQGIPLVGLNIRRKTVRQVSEQGIDALDDAVKKDLPPVSCDMSSGYVDLLREIMGQHGADETVFRRFCEAQAFWDAVMASHILRFARANPDHVIVVLAGTFHAWKSGIPFQLGRISDIPLKVILPSSDASYLRYEIFLKDADFVYWTGSGEAAPP